MPTYIALYKFTDQGIKNIKAAPQRVENNVKAWEKMGGKLLGFYSTMGEYDYVSIAEAPNDAVASTFMLAVGAQGNVRTTTLKAFTTKEFAVIVKNIP